MVKANIRERAGNKLLVMSVICERIIEGKAVPVETAKRALKDIKEIMDWLDKRPLKINL